MSPDEKVVYTVCWFKRQGFTHDCTWRPDGFPDPAHWLPQQRVKAAAKSRGWSAEKTAEALWDRRCYTMACRGAHDLFDGKSIRLTEDQYPASFRAWAEEYGFEFINPRTGWVAADDSPQEAA
jgi:hypothetical protein